MVPGRGRGTGREAQRGTQRLARARPVDVIVVLLRCHLVPTLFVQKLVVLVCHAIVYTVCMKTQKQLSLQSKEAFLHIPAARDAVCFPGVNRLSTVDDWAS